MLLYGSLHKKKIEISPASMSSNSDMYNIFGVNYGVIINQNFQFVNKQFKLELSQDNNVFPSSTRSPSCVKILQKATTL